MAFLSQASVIRLYKSVIDETIASCREAFLDEGVDEQVLIELKTLWESKVTSNKAVQIQPQEQDLQVNSSTSSGSTQASTSTNRKSQPIKRNTTDNTSAVIPQHTTTTTQPVQQQQQQHQQLNNVNVYQQSQATLQQQAGTSQQNITTNGNSVVIPGGNKTIITNNTNTNNLTNVTTNNIQQQQQQTIPQQTMFSSMLDATKVVPIQITLPPQIGMQETSGRVLTIQVPATALIGNQLQQVLTGPVISATMRLPQHQASNLLQQHVNATLLGQNSPLLAKAIPQVDGCSDYCLLSTTTAASDADVDEDDDDHNHQVTIEFPDIFALARALNFNKKHHQQKKMKRKRKIHNRIDEAENNALSWNTSNSCRSSLPNNTNKLSSSASAIISQLDGQNFEHGLLEDSSEDEDDVSDDVSEDEELDDDKEDEDVDIDGGGMEEEPLNSEDDVSEEDPTDLFDTDNVVVCQYDKINRSRNKWKFYLKDGIMNLDGKDFIFQKVTGDAEW